MKQEKKKTAPKIINEHQKVMKGTFVPVSSTTEDNENNEELEEEKEEVEDEVEEDMKESIAAEGGSGEAYSSVESQEHSLDYTQDVLGTLLQVRKLIPHFINLNLQSAFDRQ